jgi:ubiquinone/menaquinone biosynthesis C-methylase UbiE
LARAKYNAYDGINKEKNGMATINENDLSSMLMESFTLREVEPHIYSVLPTNESGSEYDTQFGFIYDWVACNPIYNRLIWGYSISIFSQMADNALRSTSEGSVLDVGCGSLAFPSKSYIKHSERPVILVDQSLKMLRRGKARLIKQNGKVPDNLVFLHSDALYLPFQENTFTTILSENLLHCLSDTSILLKQFKKIISRNGKMYFTTLVKKNRFADKYLEALAGSGKLISRTVSDHKIIFERTGLSAKYETTGNILSIYC